MENISFAIEGLLTKPVEPGIYNMGDDETLSTNDVIEIICSVLGKTPRIWKINKRFITICAKVGGWLHLPLNPERLCKLTETYITSNAKIKAALGVPKMPVDARTGLIRTIESFRDNSLYL